MFRQWFLPDARYLNRRRVLHTNIWLTDINDSLRNVSCFGLCLLFYLARSMYCESRLWCMFYTSLGYSSNVLPVVFRNNSRHNTHNTFCQLNEKIFHSDRFVCIQCSTHKSNSNLCINSTFLQLFPGLYGKLFYYNFNVVCWNVFGALLLILVFLLILEFGWGNMM